MSDTTTTQDSAELEALFDSVAEKHWGPQTDATPAPAPQTQSMLSCASTEKALKKGARKKSAQTKHEHEGSNEVINEIGQLTRCLHNSLRALGCDTELERAANSMPDACDRLDYVVKLTQQAADRVLAATEIAKPLQTVQGLEAAKLSQRWDAMFDGQMDIESFKQLVHDTRGYLREAPQRAQQTEAQLLEIMMAQDFQDLTGQVLKKVTVLVQEVETRLLQVLLEHMPRTEKTVAASAGLEGPITNAEGRSDVVTNQAQVDDLLASLGF